MIGVCNENANLNKSVGIDGLGIYRTNGNKFILSKHYEYA